VLHVFGGIGSKEKTACLREGEYPVFRNVPSKKKKEILFVITGSSILKYLKEPNIGKNYFSTKSPRINTNLTLHPRHSE
jgi:hypothetical protein